MRKHWNVKNAKRLPSIQSGWFVRGVKLLGGGDLGGDVAPVVQPMAQFAMATGSVMANFL